MYGFSMKKLNNLITESVYHMISIELWIVNFKSVCSVGICALFSSLIPDNSDIELKNVVKWLYSTLRLMDWLLLYSYESMAIVMKI